MPVAGIDVGSATTKVALLNDAEVQAVKIAVTEADYRASAERLLKEVFSEAGISNEELDAVVATGYGRVTLPFADRTVTEITCHGTGARHLYPKTQTIIDLGGQDSKVIRMDENGLVTDFMMNDKCSAGTGRFLEVMADRLGVKLEELAEMGAESKDFEKISGTCTVFAESEVIGLLAKGCSIQSISRGLCESIAGRVSGMVKRVGLEEEVIMTGGVAFNRGVRKALENRLDTNINISKYGQAAGAIGAALIGERY